MWQYNKFVYTIIITDEWVMNCTITSLGIFYLHYILMGPPSYMQSVLVSESLCGTWLYMYASVCICVCVYKYHFRNRKDLPNLLKIILKTYNKHYMNMRKTKINKPTIIATFYYFSRRIDIAYNNIRWCKKPKYFKRRNKPYNYP